MGRPSSYKLETAIRICESIATGMSLNRTLQEEGMPDWHTVYKWMDERPEFLQMYARAREIQADALADEINDIADESVLTSEDAARNRLRVDARKWTAAKLRPRVYGDKQQIEHSGNLTLAQLVMGETKPTDVKTD